MIQKIIVGTIVFIIFIILRRPRIGKNEPPLVPYRYPIFGHTYDYLFHHEEFIKECFEKYGECFTIYVFGSLMTILARNSMNEMLRNHEDFDMPTAAREFLPHNEVFIYNGGITTENVRFLAQMTREQVIGNLDYNVSISQKHILKGFDKWIGDCNDPKTFYDAWSVINSIIAIPIANVFVGEEAGAHDDLVKSFGDLPYDLNNLMTIPPILSFIHKKLHDFVIFIPFKFGWSPVSNHRRVVNNRLRPVIEKRVLEKKQLGDNYKPYKDLLEYYMKQPNFDHKNQFCIYYYIDSLFNLIFAAVSSVSKAAANAVYDLAGRPEIMDVLYEEALAFNKECKGSFTPSDLKRMKKLDSFLKESFRHTDEFISLPHYVVSESFTFSNGYTLPKGRMTIMFADDSLKLKSVYGDDADEFKPFRFLDQNSPSSKVDRSFVFFGGGKHACPGRFIAVDLIKLFMHHLILNYTISTKSGEVDAKTHIGPMAMPPRGGVIFESRSLPTPS